MATPRKGFTKYKVASHTSTHKERPLSKKVLRLTKLVAKVERDTEAVLRACRLTKAEAKAMIIASRATAFSIIQHPEKKDELNREAAQAAREVLVAAMSRGRWAA